MFQRIEKDGGEYLEVHTYGDIDPVKGVVEAKSHDIPTRKTVDELVGLMAEGDLANESKLERAVEAIAKVLSELRSLGNSLAAICSGHHDKIVALEARVLRLENKMEKEKKQW